MAAVIVEKEAGNRGAGSTQSGFMYTLENHTSLKFAILN